MANSFYFLSLPLITVINMENGKKYESPKIIDLGTGKASTCQEGFVGEIR